MNQIGILSSLFVSKVHWGQQGLGRVCLGVCPQVYLHLLYLVVNIEEHSQGICVMGHTKTMIKQMKPWDPSCLYFFAKG